MEVSNISKIIIETINKIITELTSSIDNKLYSFYFIKAIAKFIKTDFELVFLDESKIELINNHYKCWRRKEESIFFSQNKK